MSNIFENYQEYKNRKVDAIGYVPLGQSIEVPKTKEEIRKEKRRKYHRDYYLKHKEELIPKMRERYYEYKQTEAYKWVLERRKLKRRVDPNKLTSLQQVIFNYMEQQYKETWQIPRCPEIAKHFGKTDGSIYVVQNALIKKWKLVRWSMWRLMINSVLSQPEPETEPEMVYVEEDKYDEVLKENESLKKKVEDLEAVALKRYRKHVDWENYSPGYVWQLKASIKTWQKVIKELKERVVYLEEQLDKKVEVEEDTSEKDAYVVKLQIENWNLKDEVNKLKKIIKILSQYID